MKKSCNRRALLVGLAAFAAFGAASEAFAKNSYLTAWKTKYASGGLANSTLPTRIQAETGSQCTLCHAPTGVSDLGNCYKNALEARIQAGRTIAQALVDIDGLDSDGDGVSNHDEILKPRTDIAGAIGYDPGLIGPTGTDPCGLSPNTPVTGVPETPTAACPGDLNLDGVVDDSDFVIFASAYNILDCADPDMPASCPSDMNRDGLVDDTDFVTFVEAYDALLCS